MVAPDFGVLPRRKRWRWYLALGLILAVGIALTIDSRTAETRAIARAEQEVTTRRGGGTLIGIRTTTYLAVWQRAEVEFYTGEGIVTVSLVRPPFFPWTVSGFHETGRLADWE